MPGASGDDQRVPVAEARLERRKVDSLGEQLPLVAEVAERVVGELLQRLRHSSLLVAERACELVLLERSAGGDTGPVPEEAGAANREALAVRELLEQIGVLDVDQADAAAHELQRAGVRVAAGLRRGDVDDDAHTGLDQLLGRDAVEVGVIDHGDVVGAEPADELLRPLAEARRAGVLDQAHDLIAVSR